jgi:hypothetical protein
MQVQGMKNYVKSDSVNAKDIKELFIIPPAASQLLFNKLQKDIKDLKKIIVQQ